ncbi:MAG: flagellar basal body L-ring protein FlgH [Pseudomonadota bacterium]
MAIFHNWRWFFSFWLIFFLSGCSSMMEEQPNDPRFFPSRPLVATPKPIEDGSIFRDTTAVYLYQDRKANRVGDIITVNLSERTQASKNADTEISKETDVNLPNPTLLGRPLSLGFGGANLNMIASGEREFTAEADTEQNNRLTGTITVTVQQVLPNGNLVVSGEKWITLNQGSEFIRLTGIVRPEDVSSENTIPSNRIADARIAYSGTGPLAESNRQGWLGKFFNSNLWPF